MSTDWELLSKKQTRLAYITVIMESAEKFGDDFVDEALENLYKFCIERANRNNIKLSVPFPVDENSNKKES